MSVQRSDGRLSVVISGKVEPWKEALLVAWVFAWTACGAYFIWELLHTDDRQMKLTLIVLLTFWAYFEIRIGRALMWRKYGKELIRVKDGVLMIKNDIRGYGKAKELFVDNVQELEVIEREKQSFKAQMSSSFWIIGGDSVRFAANGKYYLVGKGLDNKEARELVKALKHAFAAQRESTTEERSERP